MCISNKLVKTKIKNIPFVVDLKKMKYLGITQQSIYIIFKIIKYWWKKSKKTKTNGDVYMSVDWKTQKNK